MSFTGVVVALRVEERSLERCSSPGTNRAGPGGSTRVRVAGIGGQRAEAAARALVEDGARSLVSWGTAGALDPALWRGTLLLPDIVLDGGRAFATDAHWRDSLRGRLRDLRPCTAALLHSQRLLDTPEAKARARGRTGAAAADMESGAVARVAEAAGLPFVAIRAIVDRAADRVPLALESDDRLRTLLRALVRPAELAALASLGFGVSAAHRTLSRVAARLGAGLGAPA